MPPDGTLRPWLDALSGEWDGVGIVDVHVHVGKNDPDGFTGSADELVAALDLLDARGAVFPMHEPDGYSRANDDVIAAARERPRRLTAFCRVDPAGSPVGEAERALDAGARGVKLHPRAERFALSHPEIASLVALCHERRAPIIVHAGRGIPALGRDVLTLAERYPHAPMILAHAGISDLAWIWRHTDEDANVFFDTSWWGSTDLLALFTLVPPGRILFGSDFPYGAPLAGAVSTLRCALQSGLSRTQVRAVMGEQAGRLLAWAPPLEAGAAVGGERLAADILLDRVHSYLAAAMGRLLVDEPADELLELARLACEVGEDAPQARVCRSVVALLDIRDRLAALHNSRGWVGTDQVATALVVAKTPDVPLPEPPGSVAAGRGAPPSA
jgi:hypothetical protein